MFRCFSNPKGLFLLGLVTAGAVYLVVWHGTHLAAVAPLLLVLACPLMHLFMHGGASWTSPSITKAHGWPENPREGGLR